MSLFDRDSSVSSCDSSSLDGEDGGLLPLRAPPVPPDCRAKGAPSSSSGASQSSASAPATVLEQRRRVADADAARRRCGVLGSAPWRSEVMRHPPITVATQSTASSTGETSKFGSSIAAAAVLRKEEKEKLLLRRLQQQRKAEEQGGDGNALAQKDLEVGVFVTASYRAMLQRNIRPSGTESRMSGTDDGQAKSSVDGEDEEEERDHLSVYLRQLESESQALTSAPASAAGVVASASSTAGDYYDRIMKMPLQAGKENNRESDTGKQREEDSATCQAEKISSVLPPDSTAVVSPTLAELQDLIGGPSEPSLTPTLPSYTQSEEAVQSRESASLLAETAKQSQPAIEDAEKDVHSAVLAHARLLYDTREARHRRIGTDAIVQACARRCNDRIASSLFCSQK
ncbi:hypothetical protein ABL78_6466 [Leptomonas seymouri]|uniref:Uncharacterized protein n=1 Tax=Leptomonas seymouri TaxID=5684 RepID=A0A0N1I0S4_LEPSE|nr:hypothetical protein ABL78_6466 [Leptomonas seymouri]|eukprot:KPI84478.1 hypothetical protein ABL78_6466 [Leptomonas seymouri]